MRTSSLRVACSSLLLVASAACGGMSTPTDVAGTDAVDRVTANETGVDAIAMNDTGATDVSIPSDDGLDAATGTDAASDTATGTDSGPSDTGSSDSGSGFQFPAGTICNDSGSARTPPATFPHVILFIMENKAYSAVHGAAMAPYFNSLTAQCGYSTRFLDNVFSSNLVSLPHYLALTSGSNCNTGLENTTAFPRSTGCITDDADPGSHRLSTRSIFHQVTSWRAYQESMPSACGASSNLPYAAKHNPPPYYSSLTGCAAGDIAIAHANCPTSVDTRCGSPNNALTRDLANDTLPQFAFVTPDQMNDMHDGTISQGDNFLHTYLPLVFASPAYRRGEVAVYVMWDESTPGQPQPNLFISPYTPPTASNATMNLFSVLRTIEDQLGIATHLGCANGTPPGGIGTCPNGSMANLRNIFHF